MTSHAPQIIWAACSAYGLLYAWKENGKPRAGTNSFSRTVIFTSIAAGLLWWGGFFGGGA